MGKKSGKYRRRQTKKAKKRKQRTLSRSRVSNPLAALGLGRSGRALKQMGQWPLLECLISQEWRKEGELCQIAVARQSSATGEVALGGFLVDLACLGVKNALANVFSATAEYRREYRQYLTASQPMTECDLDLAAKVIQEGINYARSLGFNPHSDTAVAMKILGDAHPENCDVTIPLGVDGKPLFVNGPYDDVARIIRILDRNVGQGNYDFLVATGDPTDTPFEDEL
jgi:hypothetical protein